LIVSALACHGSPLEFRSVELATVASYESLNMMKAGESCVFRLKSRYIREPVLSFVGSEKHQPFIPQNEVLYFVHHRLPLRSCIRAIRCRFRLNVSLKSLNTTGHRTTSFWFRSYNPTSVSSISAAAASSLSVYQSSLSAEASSIISSKSAELSSIASNYSSQMSAIRSGYSASFSAASSAAQTQLNPTKTAAAEAVTANAGVFMGIIAALLAALF
jgi:hypothetical protein